MKTRARNTIRGLFSRALVGGALLTLAAAGTANATAIYLTLDPNWSNYHTYSYIDTNGTAQTEWTGSYMATLEGGALQGVVAGFAWCYDINIGTQIGVKYSG